MDVSAVTTSDQTLLAGIRETVFAGCDALLCVAFTHSRGVHLLERELKAAHRVRLLSTTVFGSTDERALALAASWNVDVKVLNPGRGSTYHPKVYIARDASRVSAFVGSANLTSGLATNVEAGVVLRGKVSDPPLRHLLGWAESQWDDPAAQPFSSTAADEPGDDDIEPELLELIERARKRDPVFLTLGRPAPNQLTEVTRSQILVRTKRSRSNAQAIPAWMLNVAWEALKFRKELTNKTLLGQLRVHRSSAILAILARLEGVERVPGRAAVRIRGSSSVVGFGPRPSP